MPYYMIKTEQKALEINLNDNIYGTFAEIGAGQEVARNFFQVGAAAGTIAKTMSAYDKKFSDAIYGTEDHGRYVCENRLHKMLDHEYTLMEERLVTYRNDSNFFVFADTVAAINYTRTVKGQGWLGVRFQLDNNKQPNNLIIHVKMKDKNNRQQQESIGMLGVNMIYACYYFNDDMNKFVQSLNDGIKDRIEIDMIRLTGDDFIDVDNRLLSYYLLKYNLTKVAMFDENGQSIHASSFLYKKNLMVVRGHYRPPTNTTVEAFDSSFNQFKDELNLENNKSEFLCELTMDNITVDGKIDENDYLQRAIALNTLGKKVIISSCNNHQVLINYLSDYKTKRLSLVIGARELNRMMKSKYEANKEGRLLVAFGELFNERIKVYVYPAYDKEKDRILVAENIDIPAGIHFLYKHLLDNGQLINIKNYKVSSLKVIPYNIFQRIISDDTGWEKHVPESIVKLIKEKGFFVE